MKRWVNEKKLITNNKNTLVTHNVTIFITSSRQKYMVFSSVINGYSINWITTSTLNKSYKYGVVIKHFKSLSQKNIWMSIKKKKLFIS